MTETIRVKIHKNGIHPLQAAQGDWIDLYTSETVTMKKGEFAYIPLGVSMQLPKGYEGILAPRSSTFKNWGLLQANSIGVFDEAFCGDGDEWRFPAYATRDVTVPKETRICQFRIIRHQPDITYEIVSTLGNPDRGGWGSTGK